MANKLKPCTSASGKHAWELVRNCNKMTYGIGLDGSSLHIANKGLYRCTGCPASKTGRSGWPDEIKAAQERNEARRAALAASPVVIAGEKQ